MENKPSVAFFAEFTAANLYVLERLLSEFCRVSVFAKDSNHWQKETTHLGKAIMVEFLDISSKETLGGFDYVVSSFLDESFLSIHKVKLTISCSEVNFSKTLFLLPHAVSPAEKILADDVVKTVKALNFSSAAVFVGEAIGPRMTFSLESGLSATLGDLLANKTTVRCPQAGKFNALYFPDLAKEVTKLLFSFGPPSDTVAILGPELRAAELSLIIRALGEGKQVVPTGYTEKEEFAVEKTMRTKTPPAQAIKETVAWFRKNPKLVVVPPPQKEKAVTKTKKLHPLALGPLSLTLLLLVFLSPFILLGVSVAGLFLGLKDMEAGKIAAADRDFRASFFFSQLSKPAGRVFYPIFSIANMTGKAAETGLGITRVAVAASTLTEKVLGEEVYDPTPYSQEMALGLEKAYQDIGFLQSETDPFSKRIFQNVDLGGARAKILLARNIALSLPQILGRDKPTTYLLLFQNNMELRPTGGFIGSFAMITFDGGRVSDINVSDVYTADGQLKGHVEPPEPLKTHLGEANWFLRDSNWDPDFPTSASRAEWFLNKETGKSVDGVIGIDLQVAKSLLQVVGPIKLPDYSQTITEQNLYEETQKEVEEEFFPGSYQKTNFLTALGRELLNELTSIDKTRKYSLTSSILNNLQERHIQIFLHEKDAQRAVSALGFDGSFSAPACGGNCYSDWLGIVEANVGVNKANYFIKRTLGLAVGNDGSMLSRELTINFVNSANSALGLSGRYKVYLRVGIPQDSVLGSVDIISGQDVNSINPEIGEASGRKEVGVALEVMPQQSKSVRLSWKDESTLNFSEPGEYRLYWRKQAGTDDDPAGVTISFPTLTSDGQHVYNTNLARDFFSRISW